MARINQKAVKHIPQRTCVACREKKIKRELIRLVRGLDDTVAVDISGKAAGRGVYLCSAQPCWENGINRGRVEYSLKTRLTEDDRQQIIGSLKAFYKDKREELVDSKETEEQVSG